MAVLIVHEGIAEWSSKTSHDCKLSRPQARNRLTNLYDDNYNNQNAAGVQELRFVVLELNEPWTQLEKTKPCSFPFSINKPVPHQYDLGMDDFVESTAFEKRKSLSLKRKTVGAATKAAPVKRQCLAVI